MVADCGVDGVKVDVQGTVGLMGSKLGGGPDMTRKYHQSLERSVQAAFPGNHCINCMCHSTENLYRCHLLLSMANTAILFSKSKPRLSSPLHNDSAWLTCISIPYVIVADCVSQQAIPVIACMHKQHLSKHQL